MVDFLLLLSENQCNHRYFSSDPPERATYYPPFPYGGPDKNLEEESKLYVLLKPLQIGVRTMGRWVIENHQRSVFAFECPNIAPSLYTRKMSHNGALEPRSSSMPIPEPIINNALSSHNNVNMHLPG
jgi:hypothetical protein